MFLEEPVEQVTEAPEQKATGEGTVAPQTATGEAQDNEAQKLASEVAPGVSTKEQEDTQQDEVEELLKSQDKPNVQKRIDKLTAELKAAREELNAIKVNKSEDTGKPPIYTEDQILQATERALEDKDPRLLKEIFDYKISRMRDELIEMYQKEQSSTKDRLTVIQREWNETIKAYSRYADPKSPEVYPGSRKDLNLADPESLIYRTSKALYSSDDPDKRAYYQSTGGQKLAVADALTIILSRKGSSTTTAEAERLKRQLGKEKQKNSPVGSGIGGEADGTPARSLSDSERLAEVIAERTKYKNERIGV